MTLGGFCGIRNIGVIGGLTEKSICNVGAQHCVFIPRNRIILEYGYNGVRDQLREKLTLAERGGSEGF